MKVFGLLWNNVEDNIQIFGLHEDAVRCIVNVTKRYVVCSVAKGYDPLDFATSVTFLVRYFANTITELE